MDQARFGALPESRSGNFWRIELQTPAWLIPSSHLLGLDGSVVANGDAQALYAAYFESMGANLETFIALQYWSGGARSVRERSALNDRYYPWLLTRPGSVFILSGLDETIADQWQRCGLPSPDPKRTWRDCAFVPENGFGEICARRVGTYVS